MHGKIPPKYSIFKSNVRETWSAILVILSCNCSVPSQLRAKIHLKSPAVAPADTYYHRMVCLSKDIFYKIRGQCNSSAVVFIGLNRWNMIF